MSDERCGEPYDKALKPSDFLGAHRCGKPKGHDGDHIWVHDSSLRDETACALPGCEEPAGRPNVRPIGLYCCHTHAHYHERDKQTAEWLREHSYNQGHNQLEPQDVADWIDAGEHHE